MSNIENLALAQQMLEKAEKEIRQAKEIVQQLVSDVPEAGGQGLAEQHNQRAQNLTISDGGRIIEGVFDGQNMIGPDGKIYPVPSNYASKSKLVEGDVLKLTIAPDGSFVYKQIGPVDRKRILGVLAQDEKGEFRIIAEGKSYKVLLASLTYYHAEPGDQVTLLVPTDSESAWGAVENVIKAADIAAGKKLPQLNEDIDISENLNEDTDDDSDDNEEPDQDRTVRILSDEDFDEDV